MADSIAYLHRGRLLFQEDKDALLAEYGILRCRQEQLAALPERCIIHTRRTDFGCETLVKDRAQVSRLLPGAVLDHAGIDDIMRFYSGREKQLKGLLYKDLCTMTARYKNNFILLLVLYLGMAILLDLSFMLYALVFCAGAVCADFSQL